MSRKTILAILGVVTAIGGFFAREFGLALTPAVFLGLGAVILYVLFEGKADIHRFTSQVSKFKDPKFWLAFVSALLAALVEAGIVLPIAPEVIISILTVLMSVLFGVEKAKE